MMCPSCTKLAFIYLNKQCLRCQGVVNINIAVICENCSFNDKICTICLKKIQNSTQSNRGCGCGKK